MAGAQEHSDTRIHKPAGTMGDPRCPISLAAALAITLAGAAEGPVHYRTRGAVSARPACGYTGEVVNLLPQSTVFPSGVWRAAGSAPEHAPAVEFAAGLGPSGVQDAARVTFNAGGTPSPDRWSCLEAGATVRAGEAYTFSFSVKGPEGSFVTARGAAGRGFSRIPLNGRWQRVHLTEVATDVSPVLRIGLGAHDAREAPSQPEVTVLLWGPQLIVGRGTVPYRPSGDEIAPSWPLELVAPDEIRSACPPLDEPQAAATNLLRWTADLRRVTWKTQGLADVQAGHGPTPIGVRDGHLLQESKGPGPHGASQEFACPATGPFVASIYVRPGGRTHCVLRLELPGAASEARFDLAGLAVLHADPPTAARVDAVGKGWVRIQVSGAASATGIGRVFLGALDGAGGDPRYEGDGRSGVIVWGPQVEAGTAATSYIPSFFIPETRAADEPVTAPSP
jgi:hypothetical protein